MEPRLTGIDRGEALRALGWKGGSIAPELSHDIARCVELLLKTARPRAVWRFFDLLPGGELCGAGFTPQGEDVRALLADCDRAILIGVTLGAEVEALVRRTQVTDMAKAVILDACASAAVENVCDNLCEDLASQVAPRFLTDRFSPGYGDMPLTQQAQIFRALDITRRIGVSLTPGGLMIPQKSVTAIMGIADNPQRMRPRGCASCALAGTCVYRKDGHSCGAQ